jgi:dUTP pyrophosphatase
MKIKVMLEAGATMPTRAHEADAGLDLYAVEAQVIPAKESAVFNTGVHVQIPYGYVGMLKSKSGLNVKYGITSEGVIDASYSGSIVAKLYNHSGYDYEVKAGDKITQLVIMPVELAALELVDKREETGRGNNGFGSSGR